VSPPTGGSKPRRGAAAGKALARQMAHFSPKVIQTKRRMAHPVRRGPIASLRNAFTGLLPIDNAPGHSGGFIDSSGQYSTTRRRRREFAVVLALIVVAAVVSASLPGGWARSESPSSSARFAANQDTVDPTDLASLTSEDPSPSDSPSVVPSPSESASPTATPTAAPKKTPTPPQVYNFVALGDSLTAWPATDPWPTRVDVEDARLHLVHNAGVPGDRVVDMLARLNKDVFAYNPSVLLILGGTNDIGKGYSQATAIANMKSIIIAAKARKIRVYLITIPPDSYSSMAGHIDSYNAALTNLGNAYRIVVINIHDVLSTSTGVYQKQYTVDGVHFTSLGAQVVADVIYARLHHLGY
jgi:lysophospholipase L1-like esterase